MRRAWVEADRVAEVRGAARDWKQAGAIDDATLAAIEAEYPTPRIELARAWKVLVFLLVSVAILGVHAGIFGFESRGSARFFVYAAILTGITELLRGSRLAGIGSDAATSFWAVGNVVAGFAIALEDTDFTLLVTTIAFAAAGWRWGFPLYAPFAAIAGFVLLARSSAGRPGWAIVGAASCVLFERLSRSRRLAPSRRRAFSGVFVVSALALYGAINLYSRDQRIVERIAAVSPPEIATALRPVFVTATALVPILLIAWGVRARRRLILDTGALLAALSILTLQYYVRFGSIAITAFGLGLVGAALWLNRRLRRAPGEEVRGFTASPVHSGESEALAPAAALAAAAASPISPPHSERDFAPGGGRYGGGGAGGEF